MTENTQTNKVVKRGISTARGTTRLKFTEKDSKNGLFIAHLDSVDVKMVKIGEETTGMPTFNGLEIPRITFTFASNEDEVAKRKYAVLSFMAQESSVETIPNGKGAWKVDNIFNWFKHIIDVFVLRGTRELTPEEESALSLPFEDYDENGDYVAVDVEKVIAGWKTVFESMAAILNTGKDGAEYYKVNGKPIPVWIKLLRYVKSGKKGWTPVTNGDLAFPSFVGEGCIELFKNNTVPAIHINVISECIVPKNIEKNTPKAPNMPAAGIGAPGMGGVNMGGFDAGMGMGFEGVTGNDMPFDDDMPN